MEVFLRVDRDQVENEDAQQSPGTGQVRARVQGQNGYAGIASSGRDAVTGHSVGYELIRSMDGPIGTGRDETVVPVTSRVRR